MSGGTHRLCEFVMRGERRRGEERRGEERRGEERRGEELTKSRDPYLTGG